jgi:hypothetical protein
MQDRELVAAIVAGDPLGLAEAYDRYAAPLYAYCRSTLPGPQAAGEAARAVTDTFIVATAKLPGLSDPDQLGSWLHAVARSECLRTPGPVSPPPDDTAPDDTAPDDTAPDDGAPGLVPPAGLREQVLEACTDSTPAGRANRVSVAHRAGSFGRTGFPKPIVPAGPPWWHEVRRHPRAAGGVAAAAAVVVAAAATLLIVGGTHRVQASTIALGGGGFGTSSAPSGPASGRASPSGKPAPVSDVLRAPVPPSDEPAGTASPGASRPAARSSSSPSKSPSGSPSPSRSPSPVPGTLRVAPKELALSAVKGKAASGTFIVTAVGGPVNFSISSASAKVTVSPASGSLGSAGSRVTVMVTVKSLVAVHSSLTVNPGHIVVTVLLSIKA